MIDIADDPRFHQGIAFLNSHDYEEAGDLFEDLFFEAVRDEVSFARVFLQVAAGAHHLERGQRQAAIDRLAEGVKAIDLVTNDRGWDLLRLREDVRRVMAKVRAGEAFAWVEVFLR